MTSRRDDFLALLAEAIDAERNDVAHVEEESAASYREPTPGGVPVVTMSPGNSVMNCET